MYILNVLPRILVLIVASILYGIVRSFQYCIGFFLKKSKKPSLDRVSPLDRIRPPGSNLNFGLLRRSISTLSGSKQEMENFIQYLIDHFPEEFLDRKNFSTHNFFDLYYVDVRNEKAIIIRDSLVERSESAADLSPLLEKIKNNLAQSPEEQLFPNWLRGVSKGNSKEGKK